MTSTGPRRPRPAGAAKRGGEQRGDAVCGSSSFPFVGGSVDQAHGERLALRPNTAFPRAPARPPARERRADPSRRAARAETRWRPRWRPARARCAPAGAGRGTGPGRARRRCSASTGVSFGIGERRLHHPAHERRRWRRAPAAASTRGAGASPSRGACGSARRASPRARRARAGARSSPFSSSRREVRKASCSGFGFGRSCSWHGLLGARRVREDAMRARRSASCARARDRRERTVPMSMPQTCAASA